MKQAPIFEQASRILVDKLREGMVPIVIHTADSIRLAHPGAELDFRFGVYLYDIEALHPSPPKTIPLNDSEHQFPDRLLALRFLLFANRKAAFDSMDALDEMIILESAIRTVHSMGLLVIGDQRVKAAFFELPQGEKSTLWQSLSTPLQPAVYLTLEPLRIPSTRIEFVPPVRDISVSAHRKEEG